MSRIACALIALGALCCAAIARQVNVGVVPLNLPAPAGYCDMDDAQPSDARMINAIKAMLDRSGNRLLSMSADCQQLRAWRAGQRPLLANFAQHQTLKAWENRPLPATPAEVVKSVCAELRTQGETLVGNMTPTVQNRIDEVIKAVKLNEMKFLGVIAEEASACYASLLQRLRAETGADVTQVTVFAATIVKDKLVYYYLFAPYESGKSVSDLHAQLRGNVAALQAANPN